jgi:hypothetical protein
MGIKAVLLDIDGVLTKRDRVIGGRSKNSNLLKSFWKVAQFFLCKAFRVCWMAVVGPMEGTLLSSRF